MVKSFMNPFLFWLLIKTWCFNLWWFSTKKQSQKIVGQKPEKAMICGQFGKILQVVTQQKKKKKKADMLQELIRAYYMLFHFGSPLVSCGCCCSVFSCNKVAPCTLTVHLWSLCFAEQDSLKQNEQILIPCETTSRSFKSHDMRWLHNISNFFVLQWTLETHSFSTKWWC
jgi:hypothetical protein